LISLGEINPNFSGSATPDLVTSSGNTASLVFTKSGASGRDVTGLTSLQLLSVPALPLVTNAPPSTSVTLAGNVSRPGSYKFQGADPQNVSPITETVNGDTYTGPPFFALIDPSNPNILNQYVATAGTDGYEVVLSLAELDPALGASTATNQVDLVPYADTGGKLSWRRAGPDDPAGRYRLCTWTLGVQSRFDRGRRCRAGADNNRAADLGIDRHDGRSSEKGDISRPTANRKTPVAFSG
jgi:hypothetical protein